MNTNEPIPASESARRNRALALLFAVVLLTVAIVFVVLPPLIAAKFGLESSANDMFGSYIALLGILLTGIFVFMTFRIDNGAKREAHQTARETAVCIARKKAKKQAKKLLKGKVGKKVDKKLSPVVDKKLPPVVAPVLSKHLNESRESIQQFQQTLSREIGEDFDKLGKKLGKDFSALEDALREHVGSAMPAEVAQRLPDELAGRLPSALTAALPSVVEEGLPAEVAQRLPGELASRLSSALTAALPPVVEERLPVEVAQRLPGELAGRLPSALTAALLSVVEERLPAVARPLAATQLKAIVEDERKEQLYRQMFDEVLAAMPLPMDTDRFRGRLEREVMRVLDARLSAAVAQELKRRKSRFWPFGRGDDE